MSLKRKYNIFVQCSAFVLKVQITMLSYLCRSTYQTVWPLSSSFNCQRKLVFYPTQRDLQHILHKTKPEHSHVLNVFSWDLLTHLFKRTHYQVLLAQRHITIFVNECISIESDYSQENGTSFLTLQWLNLLIKHSTYTKLPGIPFSFCTIDLDHNVMFYCREFSYKHIP